MFEVEVSGFRARMTPVIGPLNLKASGVEGQSLAGLFGLVDFFSWIVLIVQGEASKKGPETRSTQDVERHESRHKAGSPLNSGDFLSK